MLVTGSNGVSVVDQKSGAILGQLCRRLPE